MILQALTAYYEQLLAQGKVEAPGWDSKFKVSYELRLGPDGQLLALNDLRQEVPKGKKTVIAPRELPVPHRVKRASGVAANFLCDNTSYLLGADEKGKPERSRQCFEACAALHHKVLDGVDSPASKAILAFFDSWEPDTAPTHPLLAEQWADLNNNANLMSATNPPTAPTGWPPQMTPSGTPGSPPLTPLMQTPRRPAASSPAKRPASPASTPPSKV